MQAEGLPLREILPEAEGLPPQTKKTKGLSAWEHLPEVVGLANAEAEVSEPGAKGFLEADPSGQR